MKRRNFLKSLLIAGVAPAREVRPTVSTKISWQERKDTLCFSVNEQLPSSFRLRFITNGGNVACLGSFHKINPQQLRHFVRKFHVSWVNA